MPATLDLNEKRVPSTRGRRQKPRTPLWRLRVWQVLLIIGVAAIAVRLYYLQIYMGPTIKERAKEQRQKTNLLIHRGAITDRHGLPLAIDTTRYNIYIHPRLLKVSMEEAANTIAKLTKTNETDILAKLNKGYPVVTIGKHLEREVADELHKLNWTGLDIVPRPFRHYPEGTLAAHILGYVNSDTKGQGGVEQSQQEMLNDTGTIPKPQLDGRGKTILLPHKGPSWDITPPLGRHVELTIDNTLQHMAEKELSAMGKHSHCKRAAAIIMDPSNGDILAWANYPSYDPNNFSKYPFSVTKNWAMVDVYQPGSTFKVLTVSAGLDTKAISPSSTFHDGGAMTIGRATIHNSHGGNGTINLLQLFIHSSNIGAAQVAMRMTPQQFYDKLKGFGMGGKTGIELQGESRGLLLRWQKWKQIDQATTGFGQGAIAVTPLQLIAGINTVANKGEWVQPHLIRRTYDPRTGVTEKWTEPERRRVISPEVAKLVSSLLAQNIAQGSQIAGKVPGYRVAGKTGTAQKVREGGKGYVAGETIASFCGFFPAEDPQLICLVVVDSPQTDGRWGNTIAGPVFNGIAAEAARLLAIHPSYEVKKVNGKLVDPDGKVIPPVIPPSIKYAAELPGNKPL